MGRKDKKYSLSLHTQAYNRLQSMLHFGESKKEAKQDGSISGKIFSHSTYRTYKKHIRIFINYVKDAHPECTTLNRAKTYVNEWLEKRSDEGLSAWTIQTEAKALGKLYGINLEDPDYFHPPKRERKNIKRSRKPVASDARFSETRNRDFVCYCRNIGPRRSEVSKALGKHLFTRSMIEEMLKKSDLSKDHRQALEDALLFEYDYYLYIKGKGGRIRYSPIISNGSDRTITIKRIKNTLPEDKLWPHIPTSADIHSYRAEYATAIYRMYARDIEDIPYDAVNKGTGRKYQSDVYVCRKDEQGRKLDKHAMFMASKALGHNRIEVVANNYLRGI